MSIRSLSFTIDNRDVRAFRERPARTCRCASANRGTCTPGLIVATKPDPKHNEMKYCSADSIYFTFEPASKYSPNEYILFYYMDEHKDDRA